MGTMASQITSLTIVYLTVYLGADQRKHQSSASLAFVRGIHRSPVKMFPFDDVIMSRKNVFPCSYSCDRYKMLHTARQLSLRGNWKNVLIRKNVNRVYGRGNYTVIQPTYSLIER